MAEHQGLLADYDPNGYYCDMFGGAGAPAEHTLALRRRLARMGVRQLKRRARDAERELYSLGITFTVYS